MKLAINLATRGRPELLIDTIRRTAENIKNPRTELMVSIDDDDQATMDALTENFFASAHPVLPQLLVDRRPREDSLGAKFNRVLERIPDADVYLAMVDYAPHVTPGFDEEILKASQTYPDGLCVVYNRLANLSFPGINAVTRRLVHKMGYFYPEYFPFWYVDHWLGDLAEMMGRIAYVDVEIDTSRKPPTQSLRDLAFWCEFFNRSAPIREDLARRIIGSNSFAGPEWQKLALMAKFPLIRQRSKMLNDSHVATSPGVVVPDEPRFERLRERANAALEDIGVDSLVVPDGPRAPLIHPYSVAFATPMAGWNVTREFWHSSLQTLMMLQNNGVPSVFLDAGGDPYLDKVRSKLSTHYLNGLRASSDDAPFLPAQFFFIDADEGWPPLVIAEFLSRPEGVIVGAYPKKSVDEDTGMPIEDYAVELEEDEDGSPIWKDGLVKVRSIAPTGFMLIKRWVLERFTEHHECRKFIDTVGRDGTFTWYHEIFTHGTGDNFQFWGEDTTFVRRCRNLGIDVWCYPDVDFLHRGSYVWRGNFARYLERNAKKHMDAFKVEAPMSEAAE